MSSMLKPPATAKAPRPDRAEAAQEAAATTYVRARNFIEEHRVALIAAAVGIAVIFLGVLGFLYYQRAQAQQAEARLAAALPAYEAGNYQEALDGTPEAPGLLAVADDYRRTPAGNLAAFYAGNALLQLGRYEEADQQFARFRGQDFLRASALAGRAAAAEAQGDYATAARFYEQAARVHASRATAPEYLFDAARAFEAAGDLAAARRAYEAVAADHPDSPLAANVPVHLARLDVLGAE